MGRVRHIRPRGARRSSGGEREADPGTAAGPVLGPDPAPVRLDETTRDREPEAGPTGGAGEVAAPEALEHPSQRLRAEPLAGVLDDEPDAVLLGLGEDGDRPVGRRVPERV